MSYGFQAYIEIILPFVVFCSKLKMQQLISNNCYDQFCFLETHTDKSGLHWFDDDR